MQGTTEIRDRYETHVSHREWFFFFFFNNPAHQCHYFTESGLLRRLLCSFTLKKILAHRGYKSDGGFKIIDIIAEYLWKKSKMESLDNHTNNA